MESELRVRALMASRLVGNSNENIDLKYGLRENPRKTWRGEDLKTPLLIDDQKLRICKQCGKGFKSVKALCGHMACHSEKDRFFKDDTYESGRKRQKKTKFCDVLKNNSSFFGNDFEQEEGAMCLIMLSRDNTNWVSVGSNQESSDSVVLETKSSSIDVKIGKEIKNLGKRKQTFGVSDSENEESTDGYFEINDFGENKLEGGSRKKYEPPNDSKTKKFVSENEKKRKNKNKRKKKIKAHECPYCDRVFKSGQALGGHKRTHSLGNYGKINNPMKIDFEAETSEVRDRLDLNLPAPEEEEESENSGFVNW